MKFCIVSRFQILAGALRRAYGPPSSLLFLLLIFNYSLGKPMVVSAQTWENIGPVDLNVQSLAIDPIKPTTLYASVYTLGLFTRVDGGATWRPINHGFIDDRGFIEREFLIDPKNPATLYAANGALRTFGTASPRSHSGWTT